MIGYTNLCTSSRLTKIGRAVVNTFWMLFKIFTKCSMISNKVWAENLKQLTLAQAQQWWKQPCQSFPGPCVMRCSSPGFFIWKPGTCTFIYLNINAGLQVPEFKEKNPGLEAPHHARTLAAMWKPFQCSDISSTNETFKKISSSHLLTGRC